ncbi:MAG: CNP1-like family protein [Hydrogenophaga sp.]|jgi:hypothetical protein|nr:CNP1-like family protein [Hydrogenophaga sp.]
MNRHPAFAALLATGLLAWSALSHAQYREPEVWEEAQVPAPTDWRLERVVEFALDDRSTSLRFGIDPDTLSINNDGVVRYVFVARSPSGAVNALFEGIRCKTAEVRVYARWDPDARNWLPGATGDGAWQPLDNRGMTRRAMQVARGGVCDGAAPNRSPALILDTLRNGRKDIKP